MWYAITFLVGGIPAFIFYLLWRSRGKKLSVSNKKVIKFHGLVERLRKDLKESDYDYERLKRALKAGAEHADALAEQIADSIKKASARGDGASVSDLINSNLDRVRKLSEAIAYRGDQDAELRRRDRATTVDTSAGGLVQ